MGKLFKLKFYCNYCKRQCVDENGFRVHCATFSHQAAVERFNRDPARHTSSASTEFLEGFCAVLRGFAARQKIKLGSRRAFEDKWVDANLVYQEYIRDRHHTHLSATRWKSVAGFLRFLGQKGIAEVKQKKAESNTSEETEYLYILPEVEEETSSSESEDEEMSNNNNSHSNDPSKRPKWFIKLIDKSPEAILAAKNKSLLERNASEEQSLQAKQLEAVQKQAHSAKAVKTGAPVVLIQKGGEASAKKVASAAALFNSDESDQEETKETVIEASGKRKHLAVLDEMKSEETPMKRAFIPYETAPIVIEAEPEEVAWIRKGLLIKIKNDSVGEGKYFGLLAVIDAVIEDFGAQVTVLQSGDQLLLDQDDCTPVGFVSDAEFDAQLRSLDAKITANALKSDRCIIVATGREGRVLGKRSESGKFQVEVTEAGASHIHRLKLDLSAEEFCIFFE